MQQLLTFERAIPTGQITWRDEDSMLYGRAVLLSAQGDAVTISAEGCQVAIVFTRHDWSGVTEIEINEKIFRLDLFSITNKPWIFQYYMPKNDNLKIKIRASGSKNELSRSTEVCVQAVYVLDKPINLHSEQSGEQANFLSTWSYDYRWETLKEATPDLTYILNNSTFYMVAFTPRCGSNLLSDYLKANGFGYPTEYFQYPFGDVNRWYYQMLGIAPEDFVGFLRTLFFWRSNLGIFGAKLAWGHRCVLVDEISSQIEELHDLISLLPKMKWLYSRRRDKVRQAISLWRAQQTNLWHVTSSAIESAQPEYDYSGILSALQTLLVEELIWDDYFQRFGIKPFTVWYEDLVADPRSVLALVFEYILDTPNWQRVTNLDDIHLDSKFQKMADEYSEELKAKFMDDLYHMDVSDTDSLSSPI